MTRASLAGLLVLGLAGCPSQVRSDPPMSPGFDKALSSFRDYAAAQMQLPPKRVLVGPNAEAVADGWKLPGGVPGKLGQAWAFEATAPGKAPVRGWATPDGAAISFKDNLGRLFVEAGAWTSAPRATADELAKRLAWASGPNSDVDYERGAPALKMEAGGGGALKFFRRHRPPGPGTKEYLFEVTVTLTPDRAARVSSSADLDG